MATNTSKCVKCEQVFDRGKPENPKIQCKLCKIKIHAACANLNTSIYNKISPIKNIWWVCDSCDYKSDFFANVLKKLDSIEKKMSENTEKLIQHDEKLIEIQKTCEIRRNFFQTPVIDNSNKSVTSGKRPMAEIIRESWADQVSERTPKLRKTSVIIPQEKYDPIVVIQTTNEDDRKELEKKVRKVLNPTEDPIQGTKTTANGKVLVHCNNHAAVCLIKNKLQSNLDDNITVDEPKLVAPRIKVVGIDAEHISTGSNVMDVDDNAKIDKNQDQLLKVICKQNNDLIHDKAELQIINVRKRFDKKYEVIISCDFTTFNTIMRRQKLKIGWDICYVYEQLNVLRCYKCNDFSHTANNCKSVDFYCPRCAGKHEIKDCTSEDLKCINCVRSNERLNVNLNVNHPVWSSSCKVYERKMNQKRLRTRYKQ